MKKYVLGFAFNDNFVLLIKKNKPEWQKGLYNGLGGKIEKSETPVAAMVREFKEECGIQTKEEDWEQYAVMIGDDFKVYCFESRNIFDLCNAKKTTSETPETLNVYGVFSGDYPTISNLPALIGLARDNNRPQMTTMDYCVL